MLMGVPGGQCACRAEDEAAPETVWPAVEPDVVHFAMRRIKLGSDARMRLFHEYNFRCAACKKMLPPAVEVDHFIPLHSFLWKLATKANPNRWANLQPLCPNCHAEKSMVERMHKPVGSSFLCQCGDTHSIYFRPRCDAMREQVMLLETLES